MPKQNTQPPPLEDIANYHKDVEKSLRLYFSSSNPDYSARFATYLLTEVADELKNRINETDIRSSLTVMALIEAAFYLDYNERCKKKGADNLSVEFRKIFRKRSGKARLDKDILEGWRKYIDPSMGKYISQLRGMFKYRHWIAHGRYWQPDNKFDFQSIYLLAVTVLTNFPLMG
ncbi:MAG: hypothetical protein KGI54_04040 [Pseudomonadota bacterium]|nr:hypothetical protein [Pseudomonadota bacterium]